VLFHLISNQSDNPQSVALFLFFLTLKKKEKKGEYLKEFSVQP